MGEPSGKVAIVTGASKGIGAAIARRFAEAGAAVAVNYASSKADADKVVDEIVRKGGKAAAIQADVAKSADVKRLFAETKAKLGAPSILVNNAGVFTFGPLEAVTEEDFHRQFDTNVLGTILASARRWRLQWRERQRDQSQHDFERQPGAELGRLFGLEGAVDPSPGRCARAGRPKKIRVNAIAPGMTETEGTKTMGINIETAKAIGMAIPMGRWAAGRYRARGAFPRLRPVVVADRRTHFSVRRPVIMGARLRRSTKAAPAKSRSGGF